MNRKFDLVRAGRRVAPLSLATILLVGASTLAAAQKHTHGRLSLNAAVDAQSITILLEVPLDNFLGFERAPRTEAERKLVEAMVMRLNAADKLFSPDPSAECALSKVELDSAVLGLGAKAKPEQRPSPSATSNAAEQPAEHADIDVSILFSCSKASQARYIDVKLFDAFKNVRTIDAQVAFGKGQVKRTLTKKSSRLTWGD